jgi:hypothetical protein
MFSFIKENIKLFHNKRRKILPIEKTGKTLEKKGNLTQSFKVLVEFATLMGETVCGDTEVTNKKKM